ncbi:MAG: 2-amino-4-hydroxy-6-hydroxymethyldihydropteridine diphosphokinase [Bifidobacteriaceae bacterium]|nr:2-amino-4-hydroxy-6-hydroxymethyldihydropteridine diphosphokinase [Bifidobacteriaceae bacterium]
MAQLDTITLTGVSAMGTHGVLDAEHRDPQPFVVDATMWVDLSDACRSDDLVDTVSYSQIAERIVSVIGGEHCDLIERLAQKIADSILLSWRVRRVQVTVHKPKAPIGVTFGDVSVTITRSQTDLGDATGEGLREDSQRPSGAADGGAMPAQAASAAMRAGSGGPATDGSRARDIHHVVIAMGGNIGDAAQAMRSAIVSIDGLPGTQVTGISPLYRTAPWGMEDGTPDFMNAVVQIDTTLDPGTLLTSLQLIETAHGRSRDVHWGSRPLDLDIIDIDGEVSDDPQLTLPHPRAWQRAFVLAPWLDLDPAARLHGEHGGAVRDLIAAAPDCDAVRKISDSWILSGQGFQDL